MSSADGSVSKHCLLLMDMVFKKKVKRKVKFRKKLKLWRLRESEMKEDFAEGVNNKYDGNEDWCSFFFIPGRGIVNVVFLLR